MKGSGRRVIEIRSQLSLFVLRKTTMTFSQEPMTRLRYEVAAS